MKTPLGEKIRLARTDARLTQKELSEKLQCTEVMISRYELGAVPVSIEKLKRIAAILGKTLSFFFDDVAAVTKEKKSRASHTKKAFVFDLDDTLVDGRKFCGETIARAITSQVPSANFDLICQIHDSIRGMTIEDLYKTILTDLNIKADIGELLAYDRVIQQENIHQMGIFDGVIDLLEFLRSRGKELYICTNRTKSLLDDILEKNGIRHYFKEVISCADAGFKKPNPYCLVNLIQNSDYKPEEFIYFGDSEVDSQFAQNAGIEHIIFDQYLNNNNLFAKLVRMFME